MTISDELARQVAQRFLKSRSFEIDKQLAASAKCGQKGRLRVKFADDFFAIESGEIGLANLGNWQLRVSADCSWRCNGDNLEPCCCTCKAFCALSMTISKTYTFRSEGYNPANKDWKLFPVRFVQRFFQGIYQGSYYPDAYFISAQFSETYTPEFQPKCK